MLLIMYKILLDGDRTKVSDEYMISILQYLREILPCMVPYVPERFIKDKEWVIGYGYPVVLLHSDPKHRTMREEYLNKAIIEKYVIDAMLCFYESHDSTNLMRMVLTKNIPVLRLFRENDKKRLDFFVKHDIIKI